MDCSTRPSSRRSWKLALVLCTASLLVGSTVLADRPSEISSSGNYHKGTLSLPLIRGAAMQPEVTLVTTPGNCERQIDMSVRWNEEEDWVKVKLRGKGVLVPYPNVPRTEGVNFFPNPFWPEAKDIVGGRYQFWFIAPAGDITFYYDATTLDIMGSQYEFPTPPPGAIPLTIPSVKLIGSEFFEPDENGDLDVDFTFQYSAMGRGDLPDYSHHIASFPPFNLCEAHPYRYDLSSTRGYFSPPRPKSEALSFSDFLRNAMNYAITTEPPSYYVFPPRDTQIITYSNSSLFGGGIPRGYTWDLDAAFMNIAPGIRPFPGAGSCTEHYSGVHTKNLNFCGQ